MESLGKEGKAKIPADGILGVASLVDSIITTGDYGGRREEGKEKREKAKPLRVVSLGWDPWRMIQ